MGTTQLFVFRKDDTKLVEIYFRGSRGGARAWKYIVDGLDSIARDIEDMTPGAISRPDGRRSLGQSASLIATPRTILQIIRGWTKLSFVRDALDSEELRIIWNLSGEDNA